MQSDAVLDLRSAENFGALLNSFYLRAAQKTTPESGVMGIGDGVGGSREEEGVKKLLQTIYERSSNIFVNYFHSIKCAPYKKITLILIVK